MEGMRFGVLPIVAPTGGLADTVHDLKARSPPPPLLAPPPPRAALPEPNRFAGSLAGGGRGRLSLHRGLRVRTPAGGAGSQLKT